MLEEINPPLLIRVINAVGRWLRAVGIEPVRITPELLETRARSIAALSDFGEADFKEGLEHLCRSVNEDAYLSLMGRLAARDQLAGALVTRLRRIEAKKSRPEIFEAPLIPPLIVLGLPRSGTTMLHRLLSMGHNARPLKMWELRAPIAGPGPDRRREAAVRQVKTIKAVAPAIDAKHFIDADQPEECVFLLESSLVSGSFWMMLPVYGYFQWYLEQDLRAPYRVYREHLQIFQAEIPDHRLTLKAPLHAAHIEELIEAIPNAMIVHTIRDPIPVLASMNSLFYTLHSALAEKVDVERMARTNAEAMGKLVERSMRARARVPSDRFIDLRYDELVSDPAAAVKKIYDYFGLQFDPAFEARLKDWLENRPQHKYGKHDYSLEEFGLSEAWVREKFSNYYETFLGK